MEYKYDFFIAHAGPDSEFAVKLYDHLYLKSRVFLDTKCLLLGDDWDISLAAAQQESAVTVVLVSSRSDTAYYQREEIAVAISMARSDSKRHRVVPVFLDPGASSAAAVPYGLRLKHGLHLPLTGTFDGVAQSLLDLKAKLEPIISAQALPNESLTTNFPTAPAMVPNEGYRNVSTYNPEYFCYISQGKISQLYSQIARSGFIADILSAPTDKQATVSDLVSEAIPYGRPDLLHLGLEEKAEYTQQLRSVLGRLDGFVHSFSWSRNYPDSAFCRITHRFSVDAVDEQNLIATLIARNRKKSLLLDCSLSNFSHLTVSQGRPDFQSTNYAFFTKHISVTFDSIFILLSQDKSRYYGSPLFLKLGLTPLLSL